MSIKKSLWQLSIALSMGISLSVISTWRVTASAQYQAPGNDGFQSNEKDALFGGSSTGINPLDLINRMNLRNDRSLEEFSSDSEANIRDSAAEFKRQQQERLLRQQQSSPSPVESIPADK